jgi:hypothetical protein
VGHRSSQQLPTRIGPRRGVKSWYLFSLFFTGIFYILTSMVRCGVVFESTFGSLLGVSLFFFGAWVCKGLGPRV